MLLPTLANAKRKSQGVLCLNNEKQLMLSFKLDTDENNGNFIPNWPGVWCPGNLSTAANTDANTNLDNLITGSLLSRYANGSAGIYNITEPEMAARSGNRKLDNAEATSADIIVTANPGCHLQLAGGLRRRGSAMRVLHIIEVLDQAYTGKSKVQR